MSAGATSTILGQIFLYSLSRKCCKQSVVKFKSKMAVKIAVFIVVILRKVAIVCVATVDFFVFIKSQVNC
jgi:hypothetical protein